MTSWPSEQDLEDFAWGRPQDPRVHRTIRDGIAADPDLRARVDELRMLKDALHEHYDRAFDWPVPDGVARIADRAPRWGLATVRRVAIGLGIFVLGIVSGAWLDRDEAAWRSPHLQAFEQRALLSSGAFTSLVPLDSLAVEDQTPSLATVIQRLQRLGQETSFDGLRVEGAQAVRLGHITGVRVLLHGANGEKASLFVQPRWTLQDGKVDVVSRDDLSLATWVDGAFSYGLAAPADGEMVGRLAESLRSVLDRPRSREEAPKLMVQGLPGASPSLGAAASTDSEEVVR